MHNDHTSKQFQIRLELKVDGLVGDQLNMAVSFWRSCYSLSLSLPCWDKGIYICANTETYIYRNRHVYIYIYVCVLIMCMHTNIYIYMWYVYNVCQWMNTFNFVPVLYCNLPIMKLVNLCQGLLDQFPHLDKDILTTLRPWLESDKHPWFSHSSFGGFSTCLSNFIYLKAVLLGLVAQRWCLVLYGIRSWVLLLVSASVGCKGYKGLTWSQPRP